MMNDRNVTPVDYPTIERLPAYMLFYGRPSTSPIVAANMARAVGTLGVRVDTGLERQLVASTSSQLPQNMGAGTNISLALISCPTQPRYIYTTQPEHHHIELKSC
jgi:hypothetical protein